MTITVIQGGRLLNPSARVAEPADLLVRDGIIAAIWPPGTTPPEAATVIDATGRMLMPGLVNAHTHAHGALAKGRGDRWLLESLLNAGSWMTGKRTGDEMYLSAKLNAAEMVLKGCTSVYDMPHELPMPSPEGAEAVGQAYADVGMRALIAPMLADRTVYTALPGLAASLPLHLQAAVVRIAPPEGAAVLASMRSILAGWTLDRSNVRIGLGPTIPMFCGDDLLAGCRDLAAEFGAPVQMHLLESRVQAVSGRKLYSGGVAQHLDALGLLTPGFTGAHGVWLSDDDMRLMADRGAGVSHNPASNMILGSGIAPVRRMLDLGVSVGIGTDGSGSGDNQNMFEAMRLASIVSHLLSPDPAHWLSTAEVFHAATEGGAARMGLQGQIGRIAPGYAADIVFLDLSSIALVPLNDPINQLVHAEDSRAVDCVMIAGELVLDRGRFTRFDYNALVHAVNGAMPSFNARHEAVRALATELHPEVRRFCVALAQEDYPVANSCWCHSGGFWPGREAK